MQRIIGILLCVLLVLSMAACQPPINHAQQSTPNTSEPSSPALDSEDTPLHTFYAMSVPGETEYLYHENGTALFAGRR